MANECLFCDIVSGKKSADFVYQNDSVVAFNDIRPQAPVHVLIVPKRHIRSVNDLREEDKPVVAEMIVGAREIAKREGIEKSGYKILLNVERGGGQYIFHLHMHLIGGWQFQEKG